jgi:chromosome segregation ATPase
MASTMRAKLAERGAERVSLGEALRPVGRICLDEALSQLAKFRSSQSDATYTPQGSSCDKSESPHTECSASSFFLSPDPNGRESIESLAGAGLLKHSRDSFSLSPATIADGEMSAMAGENTPAALIHDLSADVSAEKSRRRVTFGPQSSPSCENTLFDALDGSSFLETDSTMNDSDTAAVVTPLGQSKLANSALQGYTPGLFAMGTPAKTPRFPMPKAGASAPITPGRAFRLGRGLATPSPAIFAPSKLFLAAAQAGDDEASAAAASLITSSCGEGFQFESMPTLDEVLCLRSLAFAVEKQGLKGAGVDLEALNDTVLAKAIERAQPHPVARPGDESDADTEYSASPCMDGQSSKTGASPGDIDMARSAIPPSALSPGAWVSGASKFVVEGSAQTADLLKVAAGYKAYSTRLFQLMCALRAHTEFAAAAQAELADEEARAAMAAGEEAAKERYDASLKEIEAETAQRVEAAMSAGAEEIGALKQQLAEAHAELAHVRAHTVPQQAMDEALTAEKEAFLKQESQLRAKLEEQASQLAHLQSALQAVEAGATSAQAVLLDTTRKETEALRREIVQAKEERGLLELALSEAESTIDVVQQKNQALEEELEEAVTERSQLNAQIDELDEARQDAVAEADKLHFELRAAKEELVATKDSFEGMASQQRSSESVIRKQWEQGQSDLASLGAALKGVKVQLVAEETKSKKLAAALQESNAHGDAQQTALNRANEELRASEARASSAMAERSALHARLETAKAEHDRLIAQLEASDADNEAQRERLQSLMSKSEELERARNSAAAALQSAEATLSSRQVSLERVTADLKRSKAELEQCRAEQRSTAHDASVLRSLGLSLFALVRQVSPALTSKLPNEYPSNVAGACALHDSIQELLASAADLSKSDLSTSADTSLGFSSPAKSVPPSVALSPSIVIMDESCDDGEDNSAAELAILKSRAETLDARCRVLEEQSSDFTALTAQLTLEKQNALDEVQALERRLTELQSKFDQAKREAEIRLNAASAEAKLHLEQSSSLQSERAAAQHALDAANQQVEELESKLRSLQRSHAQAVDSEKRMASESLAQAERKHAAEMARLEAAVSELRAMTHSAPATPRAGEHPRGPTEDLSFALSTPDSLGLSAIDELDLTTDATSMKQSLGPKGTRKQLLTTLRALEEARSSLAVSEQATAREKQRADRSTAEAEAMLRSAAEDRHAAVRWKADADAARDARDSALASSREAHARAVEAERRADSASRDADHWKAQMEQAQRKLQAAIGAKSAAQADVEESVDRVRTLERRVKALEEDLHGARADVVEFKAKLEAAKAEANRLERQRAASDARADEMQARLSKLQQVSVSQQRQSSVAMEAVREDVRAATTEMEALIGARDAAETKVRALSQECDALKSAQDAMAQEVELAREASEKALEEAEHLRIQIASANKRLEDLARSQAATPPQPSARALFDQAEADEQLASARSEAARLRTVVQESQRMLKLAREREEALIADHARLEAEHSRVERELASWKAVSEPSVSVEGSSGHRTIKTLSVDPTSGRVDIAFRTPQHAKPSADPTEPARIVDWAALVRGAASEATPTVQQMEALQMRLTAAEKQRDAAEAALQARVEERLQSSKIEDLGLAARLQLVEATARAEEAQKCSETLRKQLLDATAELERSEAKARVAETKVAQLELLGSRVTSRSVVVPDTPLSSKLMGSDLSFGGSSSVQRLREELARARTDISKVREERDAAQAKVRDAERQVSDAECELRKVRSELTSVTAASHTLEARLQNECRELRMELRKRSTEVASLRASEGPSSRRAQSVGRMPSFLARPPTVPSWDVTDASSSCAAFALAPEAAVAEHSTALDMEESWESDDHDVEEEEEVAAKLPKPPIAHRRPPKHSPYTASKRGLRPGEAGPCSRTAAPPREQSTVTCGVSLGAGPSRATTARATAAGPSVGTLRHLMVKAEADSRQAARAGDRQRAQDARDLSLLLQDTVVRMEAGAKPKATTSWVTMAPASARALDSAKRAAKTH